jgi:CxxC motif-containing protein
MRAEMKDGEITVSGNSCRRGANFAKAELTNPTRSLTTTVRTVFPGVPALPVRTDGEIPKGMVREAVRALGAVTVDQKIGCGDIVLEDVAGSGCRVIATSDILKEFAD